MQGLISSCLPIDVKECKRLAGQLPGGVADSLLTRSLAGAQCTADLECFCCPSYQPRTGVSACTCAWQKPHQ